MSEYLKQANKATALGDYRGLLLFYLRPAITASSFGVKRFSR